MADISLHYSSRAPLAGTYTALGQVFTTWRRRSRERRELALIDHRTMRELGLTEGQIAYEASKPFWQA
jgi:uncharacterized protein YjiS (DUF1127 family)